MSDWPGSESKITSNSNFKLRLSERLFDIVKWLLSQFGVI